MTTRLDVLKTYKLFIDGKFPRSESGRTMVVRRVGGEVLAHLSKASRKDLRDAVEAARRAQAGWAGATAYNRGQVMYRMAEMMEGKRGEFVEALEDTAAHGQAGAEPKKKARRRGGSKRKAGGAAMEVEAAIDRLVCFAGWADKYAQVLGCNNPVAGPYYNFTTPEATGVVAVIAPDEHPLLGLISLLAPAICSGNAVVAIAGEANPIPAAILSEVIATSDVPGGVVNLLTGERKELLPFVASHREIDAVHACVGAMEEACVLREGVGENLKRVVIREDVDWFDVEACHSPWWIEPFVEMKTIWHPAAT